MGLLSGVGIASVVRATSVPERAAVVDAVLARNRTTGRIAEVALPTAVSISTDAVCAGLKGDSALPGSGGTTETVRHTREASGTTNSIGTLPITSTGCTSTADVALCTHRSARTVPSSTVASRQFHTATRTN